MNLGQIRVNVRHMNDTFEEAISRADLDTVASCYTNDAFALPQSGRVYRGRQEIQAFWGLMMTSGLKELQMTSMDVQVSGSIAYEMGNASVDVELAEGETVVESAKYLTVWKHVTEGWKIHRHMWNSNTPKRGETIIV